MHSTQESRATNITSFLFEIWVKWSNLLVLIYHKEGRKCFIYGYMVSDILIVREETCCCHMGYFFWLTARVLLYAPSHRQNNTAFVTPVVEHWLEREIAQWVHHEGSIRWPITPWATPHSQLSIGRRKEMFYLTTHSTHFIYGYMASDIW